MDYNESKLYKIKNCLVKSFSQNLYFYVLRKNEKQAKVFAQFIVGDFSILVERDYGAMKDLEPI